GSAGSSIGPTRDAIDVSVSSIIITTSEHLTGGNLGHLTWRHGVDYQIDARSEGMVRVGKDDQEVAVFTKAGWLSFNLAGKVDGREYQLKLAAPWTGFRYLLREGPRELASAKKRSR